ncbi:DUF1684 domain-containing protein [Christiangramia sp. OXR-203]|jgi:uncharacterized protein (DUF1684 family)|uniref:DUF1684 domain-containing protein n=2 Tax=unclassified Christiangramia TaxID=2615027 RepID=UPI002AC9F0E5|nr:DUF1684 domain-containing protein [Christiangramia sp. OXR-203]WPY97963.1 DUF1684 domain-containing protein [Christiangramia sp. OXR-203]
MSSLRNIFFILILCISSLLHAQMPEAVKASEEYRVQMNEDFRDPEESPLEKEDLENFDGLEFFTIDTAYIVEAEFVRTPSESPFEMQTSTSRTSTYVKYGELYFELKGKEFMLNLYQNQNLRSDPEYFDYLFLPFTDETNGISTYDGGRYLDFSIPEEKRVTIDFNRAYNPYCAYSGRYSCPIPPKENHLETAIPAGVKKFTKN